MKWNHFQSKYVLLLFILLLPSSNVEGQNDDGGELSDGPRELDLYSRIDHENVIGLIAAGKRPPEFFFVMPFMRFGTLSELVHGERWQPEWHAVAKHMAEVAKGMEYLHSHDIIHRDLKLDNIFLDEAKRAKIGDLGLAEERRLLSSSSQAMVYGQGDGEAAVRDAASFHSTEYMREGPSGGFHKEHMVGTLQFLAPEVLMRKVASGASDVYSFAITSCEFASCQVPFADRSRNVALAHTILDYTYNDTDLTAAIVKEGLRPKFPPSSPQGFTELLERCWQHDPTERPMFHEISGDLENMALRLFPTASTLEEVASEWQKKEDPDGLEKKNYANTCFAQDGAEEDVVDESNAALQGLKNCSPPFCNTAGCATAGARGSDRMEDRYTLASPSHYAPGMHLIGIFDGHGGWECADMASKAIEQVLVTQLAKRSTVHEALRQAFHEIDDAFLAQIHHTDSHKKGRIPGTTALVLLLHDNALTIASAGDCKAVGCQNGKPVELHQLQSADRKDELERIRSCGGHVEQWSDHARVGSSGLAVTRSLGDPDVKADGIVPTPEIDEHPLDGGGEGLEYIIAATDGLWDVISPQEAIEYCEETTKDPTLMAKRLVFAARMAESGDNITVVVALLRNLPSHERIY